MQLLYQNLLLYVLVVFYLYYKDRKLSVRLFSWLWLTVFAAGSCYAYATEVYQNVYKEYLPDNATLTPYIFVFICLLIFLYPLKYFEYSPLLRRSFKSEHISRKMFRLLMFFSYIQLFFTLYSIYKLKDYSYVDIYRAGHEGESLEVFSGTMHTIYRYNMGFYYATFPFLLFQSINSYLYKSGKHWYNVFTIIILMSPSLLSGIASASRGGIVFSVVNVFFFFIIFQNKFTKKQKKYMFSSAIVAVVGVFMVMYAITYSRLGEKSDAVGSGVAQYAGESYINVVTDYWDKVYSHPCGKRLLDPDRSSTSVFFDKWTVRTKVPMAKFKTMPIDVYIDFGVWGTLVFLILFSILFSLFARKVKISFWSVGLFYWYYQMIMQTPFSWQFAGSTKYNQFIILIIFTIYLYNISKRHARTSNSNPSL